MNSSFRILFESMKMYSPFIFIKFQIVSSSSIVSTFLINPGIDEQLANNLNDQYMAVTQWYKNKYKAIEVYIKFYPSANNMTFQIWYYDAETAAERSNAKKNPSLMNKVFSERIVLLIDATLDFFISTKDGRRDGVNNDDIAIITCSSKNGVPPSRPVLTYIDKLRVKSKQFIENENKIVVHVYLSKTDHNKYVKCSSTGVSEYRYIKVFHHPTTLEFVPNYSNYMPNGSSVLCSAVDGHPLPTVTWHFISGPKDASQFYAVTGGNNLTIHSNCSLETRWVFNCTALNNIPKSYDFGVTRTFMFIISPGSKVSSVVIGSILSIFILLIIIFFVMKNKNYIKKKFSRTNKSKERNLNDELQNNSNSYFSYPTVIQSPIEIDEKTVKKKKAKRKPKKDTLVDSQIDDFIV